VQAAMPMTKHYFPAHAARRIGNPDVVIPERERTLSLFLDSRRTEDGSGKRRTGDP